MPPRSGCKIRRAFFFFEFWNKRSDRKNLRQSLLCTGSFALPRCDTNDGAGDALVVGVLVTEAFYRFCYVRDEANDSSMDICEWC